ncbi:HDOD domain-containing protein [Chitinibacteraceae bacterium HSL-7]
MKLEEVFDKIHQLPSMPKVVQELIDTFDRDDIDVEQIAAKVAMDQVISAKVLRLANTAHYGGARKVASIDDAVVVLGFNALRTLVVASGLTGAFHTPQGFDRLAFWRHSFMVATVAKWLAKQAKISGEVAYTAGMLHNIGEMLIHVCVPDVASKIDKAVALGANRVSAEDNEIGFDYVMVGAELARRWNFPEEMVNAIAHQNDPLSLQPFSGVCGVLGLAVYLVDQHDLDSGLEQVAEHFPGAVAAELGLDARRVVEDHREVISSGTALEDLLH